MDDMARWLPLAIVCAVSLAGADFFVKLASSRISPSLGALIFGATTFVCGLAWVLMERARGTPWSATPAGIAYALLVGVAFFTVTFTLYITYQYVSVSVGSPFIRLSAIIVVSLLGLIVLREPFTWRYLLGLVLSLVGIVLIVTR